MAATLPDDLRAHTALPTCHTDRLRGGKTFTSQAHVI